MLTPLRQLADEIVVAVDVSGGELDLAPLGAVADRIFQIEVNAFPEPAMAWLHAQCSCDWILRLDDDEFVSAGLLRQLPELMGARDVVQYWFTRRWLYHDAEKWLVEWPWFPDFQGRLVRKDALLRYPGLCHTNVALVLPARYLGVGFYHLAYLLSDVTERERNLEEYLVVDSSIRETAADSSLSSYLPGRHAGVEPGVVDLRDRREIPGTWPQRTLPEAAYQGEIQAFELVPRIYAGQQRPFTVRIRNAGTEDWPGVNLEPWIKLSHRWRAPNCTAPGTWTDTCLPASLAHGNSALIPVPIEAPQSAGPYAIEFALVHDDLRADVIRRFASVLLPIDVVAAQDSFSCHS